MADSTRTRAASASADDEPVTPKEAAAEAKAEEPEAETFHRDYLLQYSDAVVGHPGFVMAGALAALPASKKNFSLAEVEAAIKAFLATEVQ